MKYTYIMDEHDNYVTLRDDEPIDAQELCEYLNTLHTQAEGEAQ